MIFGRQQIPPSGLGQPFQLPTGIVPQQLGLQPGVPQIHPALLAQIQQMRGLGGYGQSPNPPGLGRYGIQPLSTASVNSLR